MISIFTIVETPDSAKSTFQSERGKSWFTCFKFDFIENGGPASYPGDLLKIYIYGYLNRIRSARVLEEECGRNIENGTDAHNRITIVALVEKHLLQKQKYQAFEKQLEQTGDTHISTSDPQSRQMITRNNITEVAYNIQATVDAKHNISIDYKVTNENDAKAMGPMVRRAKTILGNPDFTAIYDKGYQTGSEFAYVNKLAIKVMVAISEVASHAPDTDFDVEHFLYDKDTDCNTCLAGKTLTTNGKSYNKIHSKKFSSSVKHYKTPACIQCPFFEKCTRNKSGRLIERSEYADLIFENKQRIQANKETYRRRQAIGASLRHHQKAVGFLLYHDQEIH